MQPGIGGIKSSLQLCIRRGDDVNCMSLWHCKELTFRVCGVYQASLAQAIAHLHLSAQ